MSDPFGKTDRASARSIERNYVERVYDRTVIRSKEAEMSAMPAEAEPRRAPAVPGLTAPGPATLRPATLRPATLDLTALSPAAGRLRPAAARPRQTDIPLGPADWADLADAAGTATRLADPAQGAARLADPAQGAARLADPAQRAARLAPRVVVPAARPAGFRPQSAGLRKRPAGLRLRPVATRTHPVGVRSCSSIPHPPAPVAEPTAPPGEPPAATVIVPVRLPQPAPSLPAPARLRLTRRGRVVLTLGAAVTASLAWLAAASGAQAAGHGMSPAAASHAVSRIVVQPGQTLWSIATQADPRGDPRLVIQRIIAANKLAGGSIVAGQHLVIPHI
jgi:hypothetical protein